MINEADIEIQEKYKQVFRDYSKGQLINIFTDLKKELPELEDAGLPNVKICGLKGKIGKFDNSILFEFNYGTKNGHFYVKDAKSLGEYLLSYPNEEDRKHKR